MARQPEITSGIVDRVRYEVKQRVCVVGRGTDSVIHAHGTVKRFTKTLMVVQHHWKAGNRSGTTERRYRIGGYGTEVGTHEYGGTHVAPHCQRPRKES